MEINWYIAQSVALPLGTLVLGKYLDRWLTKGPKLISYVGHISSFKLENPPLDVYTHSIVIKNIGNAAANNVRVGHQYLTDYKIFPPVAHTVNKIKNSGDEIQIPLMVPNEEITISYLYYPPITWNQINTNMKSDEGKVKIVEALLQPQPPRWLYRTIWTLVYFGAATVLYLIVDLIRWGCTRG